MKKISNTINKLKAQGLWDIYNALPLIIIAVVALLTAMDMFDWSRL